MSDKTLNKDKAESLDNAIYDIFNSCGGNCDKCVLEDVCDDLESLKFKLILKY